MTVASLCCLFIYLFESTVRAFLRGLMFSLALNKCHPPAQSAAWQEQRMPALLSPKSHPAGKGVGQQSQKLRTRCQKRSRGACKEVAVCSLTAHTDRIIQGIKAGKQKTWKLRLVVTLLGDPQEPGGRKERFRVDFP